MREHFATMAAVLALAGCSAGEEAETPADNKVADDISPAPTTAEEDIDHFLLQEYPDAGAISYALAWRDLNADGTDEAIVHLVGPWFCGSGGCTTLVLTPAGPMWRKVADISVSRTPITVLDTSTNGWKDLTVAISGGGGPSGNAWLMFDGESYPGNPTVAPAEMTTMTGAVLLGEEPEMREAVPEVEAPSGG